MGEEAGVHDELRRLDEELAAGRLDADSYRRRRDELLAARLPEPPAPAASPTPASTGVDSTRIDGTGVDSTEIDEAELDEAERALDLAPDLPPPPPAPAPAAGATAGGADVSGDTATPGRDPFPPPFRWGEDTDAGSGDPSPDSTQVVAASLAQAVEVSPDRTQVVSNGPGPARGASPGGGAGAPADPTQVVGRSRVRGLDPRLTAAPGQPRSRPLAPPAPPAPPERTQFVPAAALARAGERRSVPARRTVPPWVGPRSVPPPDAHRQGREVFTRGTGPSAATIAGTAAVVLVVAVVLVLSFLLS